MAKDKKETLPTSARVTVVGVRLWDKLAESMGLSRAGVLEVLIREEARRKGLYSEQGTESEQVAA